MIYKLQNGGVVKFQNAWTIIPKSEDAILRSWERQRQKEMRFTSTGRASGMHNTDLPLQTEYPEAVFLGGAKVIKTIPQVLPVIMNPATASTTAGAISATALDGIGVVSGLNNLNNYWQNRSNLTLNDVPGIILDGITLVPGSSQLTNPGNLKHFKDAVSTIINIPKITSTSTILNRFLHPVETYRFSKLAKDSANILPFDIQKQAVLDLSKTMFRNAPYKGSGYNWFNKGIASETLHYGPGEIAGLGDLTATTDFSRGHEYGHLIENAAKKLGYRVDNFPHSNYKYGTGNLDREISENFADIIGNTLTNDAALEFSRDISVNRYPYIKNDVPKFTKDLNWKQQVSIEDIPENTRRFYDTAQKNLQTAIRENDENAISIFSKQIKDFEDKYGIYRMVPDKDYTRFANLSRELMFDDIENLINAKALIDNGSKRRSLKQMTAKQRQLYDDYTHRGKDIYNIVQKSIKTDQDLQKITDFYDFKKKVVFKFPELSEFLKQGGIVKAQNGLLNIWQKAYNSKFGKGFRDFMFGKDRDLSDEEYLEKYGYNKPVGGIGILGALVAPEWEGLEIPEITMQHIGNQGKALRWFESGNSKMLKVPIKEASKKTSNWQRFLKLSQQEQDDFVRRWNGESFQGFATLKGDKQALSRFRSWINSRK